MVVQGVFSVTKATFQIIFGQNCANTIARRAKNKEKGGFLV